MSSGILEETLSEQLSMDSEQPSWFDLREEVREIVIDKMNPKTRGRFAQCSKSCEKEAKESKNYLHGLLVFDSSVSFLMRISHVSDQTSYELEFKKNGTNETKVVCKIDTDGNRKNRVEKWTKIEPGKPSEVRMKYYKGYIEKCQNSIKALEIFDEDFPLRNNSLKHLKFLKKIHISYSDVIKTGFLSLEQIINAEKVNLDDTYFTPDEIFRFQGLFYSVSTRVFTVNEMRKYMKMWKNGELGKNLQTLMVMIDQPGVIDVRELMHGLDVIHFEQKQGVMFRFYANRHIENKCYTQVDYIPNTFVIGLDEKFCK